MGAIETVEVVETVETVEDAVALEGGGEAGWEAGRELRRSLRKRRCWRSRRTAVSATEAVSASRGLGALSRGRSAWLAMGRVLASSETPCRWLRRYALSSSSVWYSPECQ